MKLRLPKALMTAIAAAVVAATPLATTVATGVLAVAGMAGAEVTNGTATIDGNLYNTVTFYEGDTLDTAPTFSENGGQLGYLQININATETEGDVATYASAAQLFTHGHAVVNIGEGANVVFQQGSAARYDMFTGNPMNGNTVVDKATTLEAAGTQVINLGEGATMTSNCSFAGWSDGNNNGYSGTTTINMAAGSVWNVAPSIDDACEYLNRTTIVMDGAVINVADGKSLQSEHGTVQDNIFRTSATSTAQSVIQSVNSDNSAGTGKIYFQNQGVTFDVANTLADGVAGLRVDANIGGNNNNASGKNWKKTGAGILELTYENGNTWALVVEEGTVRVSGTNGRTGTGSVTLGTASSAGTLELAHTGATEDTPVNTTNNISFANAGSVLSVTGAYEKLTGNISGSGSISVADGSHLIISGNGTYSLAADKITTAGTGSVTFDSSAKINVADWTPAASKDTTTYTGFLTDSYTLFTNGSNISVADGGITLMNGGTNLGKATLAVSDGTGTLELGKYVYNIAEGGTKTYSEIRAAADDLIRVQVQSGGTLTIDGTASGQSLSPALCAVTGTGTVELAWTGRVNDADSFTNGISQFSGDLVVKSGAGVILSSGSNSFHSVTVEAGAQFAVNRAYTGDVTIAGTGHGDKGADECGALKLGSNKTLTGNVTLRGDSVAISMWNNEVGNINGDITGENAHTDLLFWNGYGGGNNTLNVSGTISKVDTIEVHRGTLNAGNIDLAGETSLTKTGTGTLVVTGSVTNGSEINVSAGNMTVHNIDLTGVASFTKTGSGNLTLQTATDEFFNKATISAGNIVLNGTTLSDSGTGKIIYKGTNGTSGLHSDSLGGNNLLILGNVSYDGELVVASGTLAYGDALGSSAGNLSIGKITIQDGAMMRIRSSGSNSTGTSIQVDAGGLLYLHDSSGSGGISEFKFKDLIVNATAEKAAKMEICWKGTMIFEALTGEGNLNATKYQDDTRTVEFKNIVNYHGTFNFNLPSSNSTLKIGHVDQAAGLVADITAQGNIKSADFSKTGAGTLNLTSLEILSGGTLTMSYDGGLSIGTANTFNALTVASGATLKYTDAANVIKLSAAQVSGKTFSLDLAGISTTALVKDGGFNLGISNTLAEAGLGTIDTDKYQLINDAVSGYWHIAYADELRDNIMHWDPNWGNKAFAHIPAAADVKTVTPTSSITLSTAQDGGTALYVKEGVASIALSGGNSAGINIYGGPKHVTIEQETWIDIKDGTYGDIVAGAHGEWDNNGTAGLFKGDTHILMEDGTVNNIIGGNDEDGNGTSFGDNNNSYDTYISIKGGTVAGAVVGASAAAHNATSIHAGDSNIFIYTVLNGSGAALGNTASINAVVGGRVHKQNTCPNANADSGIRMKGDTHITIDLTGYSGQATDFNKEIVGGSYHATGDNNASTSRMYMDGDTYVNINSIGGVTFSGRIAAGSAFAKNGNGTYTDTITGTTHLSVTGAGAFSGDVIGGTYVRHGSATVGITGGSLMELQGGTYTSGVYGGHYVEACNSGQTETLTMGAVKIDIGGTADLSGAVLAGGSRTVGAGTVDLTHSGINLVLDGGSVGTVYGGSIVSQNAGRVTQGDIVLDLNGGSIGGNVYAAGKVDSAITVGTASTTVNVGKGVTFSGTDTIVSGGYDGGNTGSATVADATLCFMDDAYTNLAGVTFKDFNIIQVNDETANVTVSGLVTDAFSKQGLGALSATKAVLTGVTGGITVANGKLVVTDALPMSDNATDLSNITIAENGTLVVDLHTGPQGSRVRVNSASSGTVYVNSGNLSIGYQFMSELGGASVDMANGTELTFRSSLDATADFGNAVNIGSGNTVSVRAYGNGSLTANNILSGAITGAGTLKKIDGGKVTITGDMSGFTGSIVMGYEGSSNHILIIDTDASVSALTFDKGGNGNAQTSGTLKVGTGHTLDVAGNVAGNLSDYFARAVADADADGVIRFAANQTVEGGDRQLYGEQNINANFEFGGDFSINGYWEENRCVLKINEAGSLTVRGTLNLSTKEALNVNGGRVSAGKLYIGHNGGNDYKGTVTMGSGSLTAGEIVINKTNADAMSSFTMTGGTLNFTQSAEAAIRVEGAGSSYSISITDSGITTDSLRNIAADLTLGNVTIEGTAAGAGLDFAAGNTVTWAGLITNSGAALSFKGGITLADSVTADSLAYDVKPYTEYTDAIAQAAGGSNGNGYEDAKRWLVRNTDNGTATLVGDKSVTLGGNTYDLAADDNGVYFNYTPSAGIYYINNGRVLFGGTNSTNESATSTLALNGGVLEVDSATALDKNVNVIADSGLLINAGATVDKSRISVAAGKTLTLDGTGTYVVADIAQGSADANASNNSLAGHLNADLGASWNGVVKFQGGTLYGADLDSITSGTVELSGVKGTFKKADGTAATFSRDVILTNAAVTDGGTYNAAMLFNNGWGGDRIIFGGKVSGEGDLMRATNGGTNRYISFTGDVSGWTGGYNRFDASGDDLERFTTVTFSGNPLTDEDGVAEADRVVKIHANVDSREGRTGDTGKGRINLTVENADKVVYDGDVYITVNHSDKTNAGKLETSGAGAKSFEGTVNAEKLVAAGGGVSFKNGASIGTATLANKDASAAGTVQDITLFDGSQITGAKTGSGDTLQVLGKLNSLSIAFAAGNVAVSNVTMQDVTLTNGSVTFGENVTAIAASATEVPVSSGAMGREAVDLTPDLTATTVKSGGSVGGTLTVDVTTALLDANRGKTLAWTILDGVTLENGFSLELGGVLGTIVENGLPGVWLSVAGPGEALATVTPIQITAANIGGINTGGLLAGYVDAPVDLMLTLENIPEPTSGALSVLALAALAARRRRKSGAQH